MGNSLSTISSKLKDFMSNMFQKLKMYLYNLFVWGQRLVIRIFYFLGKTLFRLQHSIKKSNKDSKFAFVSHILPPTASGQSIMIERILRDIKPDRYLLIGTEQTLHNQKNQINSLSGRKTTVVDDIPAERFYNRTLLYFFVSIIKSARRGWGIAEAALEENCSVIVSCSGDPYDIPAAYFASIFASIELIPYYFDDYFYQWGDRQHRRLAGIFEKLIIKRAKGCIVPNEYLQKEVISRGYSFTQIIRNPSVEVENLEFNTKQKSIDPKDVKILFAGSIYHVNAESISVVQKATRLLEVDGISCTLDIYSNQTAEQIFSSGVGQENVNIHRHVPPDVVLEKMKAADILIVPFAFQSNVPEVISTSAPGKLGDYFSSGTPILAVVPKDTFVEWFLEENRCGKVVTTNHSLAVVKEIKNLIKDRHLQEILSKNCLFHARETYSRELAGRNFVEFVLNDGASTTKVLFISASDQGGQQFNGKLLGHQINPKKFQTSMSVAYSISDSGAIYEYGGGEYTSIRSRILKKVHEKQGKQALFPNYQIPSILPSKWLSEIDIIHLQMIHGAPYFNLEILPELSRQYKLAMTIHDQWIMSGHCTYSLACDRWLSGCGSCPDLNRDLKMNIDRTADMYQVKKRVMDQIDLQLVVASQWMYDMVKQSPITQRFPVEIIPFGIDTNKFYPEDKNELKAIWNIPEEDMVISVRTNLNNVYKGTHYLVEALKNVDCKNLTIITFDHKNCLNVLEGKFNIIELGWVSNTATLRNIFALSDLFLSPSVAESFGVMPLEAMACGAVPVVFQDTVLTETIKWPEYGIASKHLDPISYAVDIKKILNDTERLQELSRKGIEMVKECYPLSTYIEKHEQLYEKMMCD